MKVGTGRTTARRAEDTSKEEDSDVTTVSLVIGDIKTTLQLRGIQMVTSCMLYDRSRPC